MQMEAPSQMDHKKIAYSSYKKNYTVKALIGCAPNGVPVFVSDLYGGSESDKSIVIQSKVLDKMEPGDLLLADKGFELYDILPAGVSLNIPSFLDNQQFTLQETVRNKVYIKSQNNYRKVRLERSRARANILVKVCVGLTLFMPTLMRELNEME